MSYTPADHAPRRDTGLRLLAEIRNEARGLEDVLRTSPMIRQKTAGEPYWLEDLRAAFEKLQQAHALAVRHAVRVP